VFGTLLYRYIESVAIIVKKHFEENKIQYIKARGVILAELDVQEVLRGSEQALEGQNASQRYSYALSSASQPEVIEVDQADLPRTNPVSLDCASEPLLADEEGPNMPA